MALASTKSRVQGGAAKLVCSLRTCGRKYEDFAQHRIVSMRGPGWRARQGIKQFVAGDKPYAWLLPVAPAVNADEDNKLNDVQSEEAKKARRAIKICKGQSDNRNK